LAERLQSQLRAVCERQEVQIVFAPRFAELDAHRHDGPRSRFTSRGLRAGSTCGTTRSV
jgi:hypothetical protein